MQVSALNGRQRPSLTGESAFGISASPQVGGDYRELLVTSRQLRERRAVACAGERDDREVARQNILQRSQRPGREVKPVIIHATRARVTAIRTAGSTDTCMGRNLRVGRVKAKRGGPRGRTSGVSDRALGAAASARRRPGREWPSHSTPRITFRVAPASTGSTQDRHCRRGGGSSPQRRGALPEGKASACP